MTIPSDVQIIRELQAKVAAGDAEARVKLAQYRKIWEQQTPDIPFPSPQK